MNDMDKLLIFLVLSLLLNIFLACRLWLLSKGVGRLAGTVADIRENGVSRRMHMGFGSRPLKNAGTELNLLMDGFQQALDEKQRLELSHRQLISNISHDIRTPLTSLLGYIEVMKERALCPEEQKEYLDIVHLKARSIYRMVEEFFDLARLESEDYIMELARVDLLEIVREVIASFYHDFIKVSVTPEILLPEKPVIVIGNRAAIERILGNLISNALRYGGDGGRIGISVREESGRARVDVQDNGRGIPENELPYVFDRLYTAEPSRNAAMRGAGLGLAIAKQLAARQNGEITVKSRQGELTVFSFCLDRAPEDI